MKHFFLALTIVGLFAACRPSRVIGKAVGPKDSSIKTAAITKPEIPKTDTQQLIKTALNQVAQARIAFTTFSAKVDVDYKGTDGKGHNVNGNIKMYKDSAIWLSVSATLLNIEGLRLLITKDSVKLMNKLEKTYAARGIGFLQEATSLPLDLYTLQDLIVGNPVYLDSNVVRYTHGNGVITLLSLGGLFRNAVTFSDANGTVLNSKLTDTDPYRARNADLVYSNYEQKGEKLFATKRQVVVSERGRLEVKLDFNNYAFNGEVSFPFKVPKNYKHL